jgi:hypothetical protein
MGCLAGIGKGVQAMGIGRYRILVRRSGEHAYAASGAVDTLPLTIGSELTVAVGPEMVRVRIERIESGAEQPVMYASEF